MRWFGYFAVMMMLSSSAQAGSSLSFVVGGHRIGIEAPRNCRSTSCVSVTIPGIYETRRGRDHNDVDNAPVAAAAAKPLDPAPVSPPVVPPANTVSIAPVVPEPPRQAVVGLAAATTQEVAPPPLPKIQMVERPPMQPPATPSVTPPPTGQPADAVRPASRVSGVSDDNDDEAADMPLGDWQAGRGSVRIKKCGRALCAHVLDPSSNADGEMLLINMKPNTASEWTGNIYSRDSGNTYYATMAIKGPDSLRVEACALGKFFCSGNLWSRIGARPEKLISSRRISPPPRS
jgi:uncharacterized protein (DUF2147 family)